MIKFFGVGDRGFESAFAPQGPRYSLRYSTWVGLPTWQLLRESETAWGPRFFVEYAGTEAQCFDFMLRDMGHVS